MRAITTDMARRELRPYFLWDEDVSIDELHQILATPDGPRRDQLLAKMLRAARDIDVWRRLELLCARWKWRASWSAFGAGSVAATHSGAS